ncbi:tRNA (adenosine(37)-N6)-threonylcarbamoyltransferase complex dimerization subunit type 1 TsaB [Halosquirtibacter xylanolyticus]|uniref:tRNA (adenosine(37)-N6)-threonylcarbamoyltransferase complex dimerization subunit type 1 TsaB n=1 Tax=Halosquirtibacter xylanolyticus TaxID=3374599 RepID=UPI00374A3C12|nr:tRNA (adenosine(37)-N6)-threonylcarbamoyltransferase complex dimerization subunit type 1 TsaB [Prolixibacteraceae bacterium]
MALILNIETATEICSVCLSKDGVVTHIKENKEGLNHANLLTVFIEDILKEADIKATDLDAVAVSSGPGSYTGLRIGVSAAKGICYGANIPLISISTLQAMANHAATSQEEKTNNTLYASLIDARRMEVFSAFYDIENNIQRQINADIIDEESYRDMLEQHPVVFVGNGVEKCKAALNHTNAIFAEEIKASSAYFAPIAEKKFQQQEFESVAYFEPFYLKDFVATQSKKNILGK